MTAEEIAAYEAETDRLMTSSMAAYHAATSLPDKVLALRPLVDRWVYLPGRGYKLFGDFTRQDMRELMVHYDAARESANRRIRVLEDELARREAA